LNFLKEKEPIKVDTLLAMIRNLWLKVKNSRTKFEQRPDDGIEISNIFKYNEINKYISF
jgi:hypothetical protein